VASEIAEQEAGAAGDEGDLADAPLPGDADDEDDAEAVEFYLLARLSALRAVSFAGSVPLAVDDALRGRPPTEVERLLGELERMSSSVQVVYLSDDPTVVDWANRVGFERAAVVPAPEAFAH